MRKVACLLGGLLLASLCASGCVHLSSWERGELARMEAQAEKRAAVLGYDTHLWMVREGALGGLGQAGGSCGCN